MIQDGITLTCSKADLRRAIIRTAAQAHWRHDFTKRNHARLIPHGCGSGRRITALPLPDPAAASYPAAGTSAGGFSIDPSFHTTGDSRVRP